MQWLDCGIGRCDACPDERRVFQPSDEPFLVLCGPCIKRRMIADEITRAKRGRRADDEPSYWMQRRARLKAQGICVDCARRPALKGVQRCARCTKAMRSAHHERTSERKAS